ncbi:5-methyltetrahydropteroyltriglutamate--homocysteine methyltransferase [Quillaja saponaria]|uniref:5-methyltetrahydropteroyltriglutamate--homocysteine methyltransferase n=1 Tax=Quillaja saponaria TaxID=32244 RepID=A0AAD7LTW1_QUISA|nr:5-methyltetrahydropteroyltriglutamate--homocysteine methyltransferase [Quillaja saponaria]
MNIENLYCQSNSNSIHCQCYQKIGFGSIMFVYEFASGLKIPSLRTLWRKLMNEKKRLFDSSTPFHVPYNPSSYSRNFDDGSWIDPDNVSRSFSARFAVPSRVFEKNGLACD